ncbi:MAG: prolipoprotein diacylglyceryl transferase [Bacteroidota bacterium]
MDSLLAINWTVDPTIFSLGPVSVRWYGLFFALAFFLGHNVLGRIFKHEKINERWLDAALMYVMVGTVIGARLGHVFFYGPYFDHVDEYGRQVEGYLSHPFSILEIWNGGLASHGAAIGIILACWLYSTKVSKRPVLWILDRVVITVALAGFFIRSGNLMNHEIVGTTTDLPFAFIFNRGQFQGVPRHPAQLYEAICYLGIFLALMFAYWKKDAGKKLGLLFGLFLVLIFGVRFMVEFVKEEQTHYAHSLPLRMGQILSLPLVLAGLFFIARSRNRPLKEG